jgi:hypothetical protein
VSPVKHAVTNLNLLQHQVESEPQVVLPTLQEKSTDFAALTDLATTMTAISSFDPTANTFSNVSGFCGSRRGLDVEWVATVTNVAQGIDNLVLENAAPSLSIATQKVELARLVKVKTQRIHPHPQT